MLWSINLTHKLLNSTKYTKVKKCNDHRSGPSMCDPAIIQVSINQKSHRENKRLSMSK